MTIKKKEFPCICVMYIFVTRLVFPGGEGFSLLSHSTHLTDGGHSIHMTSTVGCIMVKAASNNTPVSSPTHLISRE